MTEVANHPVANAFRVASCLFILFCIAPNTSASGNPHFAKLDDELNRRATSGPSSEKTSVIVYPKGSSLPDDLKKYARPGVKADSGYVLDVTNDELRKKVATNPGVGSVVRNSLVTATNFRTGIQSGAFFSRQLLGFTGAGVGIAIIDSGITLSDEFGSGQGSDIQAGPTRVKYFQDFLVRDDKHPADPFCPTPNTPCDYYGHGTHVTGTIAGNGFSSFGEKAGMAPGADIISLRVLGQDGTGSLYGVLAALDWLLKKENGRLQTNAEFYNIRVVNLSLGMAPRGTLNEPLSTLLDPNIGDPLAIATKKLVDAGLFVVGAAGNIGEVDCSFFANQTPPPTPLPNGKCDAWGGITAPGSYPWVFTAGANSSMGTLAREDDTRAAFSSRGPAFPLQNAKPDLLAGGVGIESVSAPGSTLYQSALTKQPMPLVAGASTSDSFPYEVLSGTSQAAAVVSGVAALMVEANPRLTPNLMKAVLEYTSQVYPGYSPLEQGAGFLNALGAVELSQFYATAQPGQLVPVETIWSQHFIWGNQELSGGLMLPTANAWDLGVAWGVAKTDAGENIVWGTSCGAADCGENIVWGTSAHENIVWGTADEGNIVWGTKEDSSGNIVWGTAAGDENIVWGTSCGGQDCGENIVWGTARGDGNIVWGTADGDDNIVWGTDEDGNIVWGTNGDDNIVWGTGDDDNIVWGTNIDENIVWGTALIGNSSHSTQADWYRLFLKRKFSQAWVRREFGDRFVSGDGRKSERGERKDASNDNEQRSKQPAGRKGHK